MNRPEHQPIALRGVRMDYEGATVLDVDELIFERGKSYALIGPNGAGKSMLLRIMAGTLDATRGECSVPSGLSLGYLPQRPYVFDTSVLRNVVMATKGAAFSKEESLRLAERALCAVGMEEMAQARGHGLSGGEAQRVALARLIAVGHDVLLLDEPTAPLDIEGTVLAEDALRAYCIDNDTTMILCTHAPAQALRIADDVIILHGGSVVESGPAEQVLDHPKDERSARFLAYWRI